ncbi:hypothetical protein C7T35_19365 [Variovorax sp. WS11]|nr:hypothetical protein C7T35_19365 [Variovorax sp. WS11]
MSSDGLPTMGRKSRSSVRQARAVRSSTIATPAPQAASAQAICPERTSTDDAASTPLLAHQSAMMRPCGVSRLNETRRSFSTSRGRSRRFAASAWPVGNTHTRRQCPICFDASSALSVGMVEIATSASRLVRRLNISRVGSVSR